MNRPTSSRGAFFAPFPRVGIWNGLGLTRTQFFATLAISVLLFLIIGGPVWNHLRESHFSRMFWSYLVIPPLVAVAHQRNGTLRLLPLLGASGVLAIIKLVLTAVLLIAIGIARA